MMTLAREINEWLATRPAWQHVVASELGAGRTYSAGDIQTIATQLADGHIFDRPAAELIEASDGAPAAKRLAIRRVEIVDNVNALVPGARLDLAPDGLTVIYGDNGSGKSGFARVLKHVCRSRRHEVVLTNVYDSDETATPEARILFLLNGVEQPECTWPTQSIAELKAGAVFDHSCAAAYVSEETDVTYRPQSLQILDDLIKVCDEVRKTLDQKLSSASIRHTPLPKVDPGGRCGQFLDNLNVDTSDADIAAMCQSDEGATAELAKLKVALAELESSGPEGERARLKGIAQAAEDFAAHLDALDNRLGARGIVRLRELEDTARRSRQIANELTSRMQSDDLLSGTGADLWRALWNAARAFSEAEAYPGNPYPVLHNEPKCVLCQQMLDGDAIVRMERFAEIAAHEVTQSASHAEDEHEKAYDEASRVLIFESGTSDLLAAIDSYDSELGVSCRTQLQNLTEQQQSLVDYGADRTSIEVTVSPVVSNLRSQMMRIREQAAAIDDVSHKREISELNERGRQLEDMQLMTTGHESILKERDRLRECARLTAAKRETATNAITIKSTELTRSYVNTIIRESFQEEIATLGVSNVNLVDVGGQKGRLRHRPQLDGATQQVEPHSVLSEGEQTSLGLAGFLVEVSLDASNSTVVFDDPISSLDHRKRRSAAKRLAQLASSRQVVIFTHDFVFVRDLTNAADELDVPIAERTIQKLPLEGPGHCSPGYPWRGQNVKSRLGELKNEVQVLESKKERLSPDDYEKEVADWAGKLSETLERMLSQEIVDKVFDPITMQVRPASFRVFARITPEDDKAFQAVYSKTSEWARRHDKTPDENYLPPKIEDLLSARDAADELVTRFRKYLRD